MHWGKRHCGLPGNRGAVREEKGTVHQTSEKHTPGGGGWEQGELRRGPETAVHGPDTASSGKHSGSFLHLAAPGVIIRCQADPICTPISATITHHSFPSWHVLPAVTVPIFQAFFPRVKLQENRDLSSCFISVSLLPDTWQIPNKYLLNG